MGNKTSLADGVGQAVRRRRLGQSMTTVELGDLIGKTNQAVGQYEMGHRGIRWEVLEKLASALGTRPSHIVREAEGR